MLVFFIVSLVISVAATRGRFGNFSRNSPGISRRIHSNGIKAASIDIPVSYDKLNRNGFGDPFSQYKPPLDFLELSELLEEKKHSKEGRRHSKKKNTANENILVKPPENFDNLHPDDVRVESNNERVMEPKTKVQRPMWFDFATLQQANLDKHSRDNTGGVTGGRSYANSSEQSPPPDAKFVEFGIPRNQFFSLGSFGNFGEQDRVNFTTCDEFGKKARFHPNDIVDINWLPFYIWSDDDDYVSYIHRFSFPTKKIVTEYRTKYGRYLPESVDWNQPKLLLRDRYEMLLIAVDRRGLFHVIFKYQIASAMEGQNIKLEVTTARLKIVGSYLAMMHCDVRYAVIMAVDGTEPKQLEDKEAEALVLKFVGPGRTAWRYPESERGIAEAERLFKQRIEEDKYIRVNK